MNKKRSINMSTRQIIGFGAILAMMVSITIFASWRVNEIENNLASIIDVNSVTQRHAINFRGSVHDRAIAIRDVVFDDDAGFQKDVEAIARLASFYEDAATELDQIFGNPAINVAPHEKELLANIKAVEAETLPLVDKIISLRKNGQTEEARTLLLTKARPAFVKWLATINVLIDLKENENKTIASETRMIAKNFVSLVYVLCFISLVVGCLFAVWNIVSVRLLRGVTSAMLQLADGDLEATFPEVKGGDEVADIVSAATIFRDNMNKAKNLADREAEEAQSRLRRTELIEKTTREFDTNISELLKVMATASGDMQSTAASMSNIARTSTDRTTAMVRAVETTSVNVENVASATEELASSISEIKRQVGQSSTITDRAVQEAGRTDGQVRGLSEAALRIGEVVKMISDIAEQTNLLALNATIEAARAGEAGRGFAVVASEVKQLASQTANATNEIGQQISAIQEETREAVEAIRSISATIKEVNYITGSVVAAVDQQNAATEEIARNVEQMAVAAQDVTSNMKELTYVANDTGSAATQVTTVSSDLSEKTKLVKSYVENFLSNVKAS